MASLRRHLLLGLPVVAGGLALTGAVLWFLAFCTVTQLQPGGPHVDGSSPEASSRLDAGPVPRPCFAVSDGVRIAVAGALGALIGYAFTHLYICFVFGGCDEDGFAGKRAGHVVPIRGDDDAEAAPGS